MPTVLGKDFGDIDSRCMIGPLYPQTSQKEENNEENPYTHNVALSLHDWSDGGKYCFQFN
jgi:hypothetical protein